MAEWETYLDEGPSGYEADGHTVTRTDKGEIDIKIIKNIPGSCNEHQLYHTRPRGEYTQRHWDALKDAMIKARHVLPYPVLIFKEKNGDVFIAEGYKFLRMALELGWKTIPVEIRYFGNSQRGGLVQ